MLQVGIEDDGDHGRREVTGVRSDMGLRDNYQLLRRSVSFLRANPALALPCEQFIPLLFGGGIHVSMQLD